jgi:RNA polymerase sigma-70 factor (family 1)
MTKPDGQYIDDICLLALIAQQDRNALARLFDRYAPVVHAIAFKILGITEEAEEIVLDVFSQVWRNARTYDSKRARVDTWLFLLTRSRALDRLRSLQRRMRVTTASTIAAKVELQVCTSNPEEEIVINERRATVHRALAKLPDEQKQVLEMTYYQGLSHREIADLTGISLGTIKTRIRLGLSKLRGILTTEDDR